MTKEQKRRREYYLKNRDKCLAVQRKRHADHKDNPVYLAKLSVARKKHYWKNKDRVNAEHRARYASDPDTYNKRNHAYKRANPEASRRNSTATSRRKAGLPEPTRPMPSLCESCAKDRKLNLDHCHVTGKFRGWLCGQCNMGVGLLGDSVAGTRFMLAYLERAGE